MHPAPHIRPRPSRPPPHGYARRARRTRAPAARRRRAGSPHRSRRRRGADTTLARRGVPLRGSASTNGGTWVAMTTGRGGRGTRDSSTARRAASASARARLTASFPARLGLRGDLGDQPVVVEDEAGGERIAEAAVGPAVDADECGGRRREPPRRRAAASGSSAPRRRARGRRRGPRRPSCRSDRDCRGRTRAERPRCRRARSGRRPDVGAVEMSPVTTSGAAPVARRRRATAVRSAGAAAFEVQVAEPAESR